MNELNVLRNIIIESPTKFGERIKTHNIGEVCPPPKYRISDAVISTKPKVTYCANTCSILGMSNGQETFLGHFAPEFITNAFMIKLNELVKMFKDKTGELSACVNGGYGLTSGIKDKMSADSNLLMSDIGNILDKNGAEITMISGKINPVFMDNMAVTGDGFVLSPASVTRFKAPFDTIKGHISQEQLESILEDNYQIFEVDPRHNLFANM